MCAFLFFLATDCSCDSSELVCPLSSPLQLPPPPVGERGRFFDCGGSFTSTEVLEKQHSENIADIVIVDRNR
jgi:hypothetical protein